MLTFDKAKKEEANKVIKDRQEVLREQMFGGAGIKAMDSMPAAGTRDAAVLAEFTRRMTEWIDLELDRMDYPETTYRQVFTLKTNIPKGTDAYVKYEIEANGQDDWIDEEGETTPMLDVGVIPNIRPLYERGLGYRITNREILRATVARMPIDMDKPGETRRIVEEGLDRLYYAGDSALNVYGLLTYPNIPIVDAVTGGWLSATAAQIEADLLTGLNARINATKMPMAQWDFALPLAQYLKITQTRLADGSYHSITIAQWLREQIPQLRNFIATDRLKEASADGDNLGYFIPVGARFGYGLQPGDVQTMGPHQVTMKGQDYLMNVDTGGFFTTKPLMFGAIEDI